MPVFLVGKAISSVIVILDHIHLFYMTIIFSLGYYFKQSFYHPALSSLKLPNKICCATKYLKKSLASILNLLKLSTVDSCVVLWLKFNSLITLAHSTSFKAFNEKKILSLCIFTCEMLWLNVVSTQLTMVKVRSLLSL